MSFLKILFNHGHNYRGGKQSGVVILLCFLHYFYVGRLQKAMHKCTIVLHSVADEVVVHSWLV